MNPQPRFRGKKSQIQLSLPPSCPFLSFYVPPLPPRPPLLLWSLPASPLPSLPSPPCGSLARPHAPLPFFSSPPSLAFFLSPVFLISASGSAIRSFGCTMSRVGTQYLSELPLLQTFRDCSLGPHVPQLEALGAPADASERSPPACSLRGEGLPLSDTTASPSVQLLTEETATAC